MHKKSVLAQKNICLLLLRPENIANLVGSEKDDTEKISCNTSIYYLVAKFDFDTADKVPTKVSTKSGIDHTPMNWGRFAQYVPLRCSIASTKSRRSPCPLHLRRHFDIWLLEKSKTLVDWR